MRYLGSAQHLDCTWTAGKSTLLKLMIGELEPTEGVVGRHSHLCIARYHQHSTEVLDPNKTVLEYFMVRLALGPSF